MDGVASSSANTRAIGRMRERFAARRAQLSAADRDEALRFGIALLLALLHGLLFVFTVPVWQHYDEPSHYEYSWMIANGAPVTDTGDQKFRRDVLRSMIRTNFYRGGSGPDLNPALNVSLGFGQGDNLPLAYVLNAAPLRLLRSAPVETQLYAARLVSLMLYLVTIAAAYGATRALTAPGSSLRWLVPTTLALLPGFADLMTAVSDDASAVMAFTVFTWASVVLIQRGVSARRLVFLALATGLCVVAKVTTLIALPLALVVIAFAALRGRARLLVWAGLGAAAVLMAFASLNFGDAALWYRNTVQAAYTRCSGPDCAAVVGNNVIRVEAMPGVKLPNVIELLPGEDALRLRGQTVTLGAWMWACRGQVTGCAPRAEDKFEVVTPRLRDIERLQDHDRNSVITSQPTFYAFTVTVPSAASRVGVKLEPFREPVSEPLTVFYDGVVLAEGERPVRVAPTFYDDDATSGTWGGQRFYNFVRNGSAEQAWAFVRGRADAIGTRAGTGNSPREILGSWLDYDTSHWYYELTAAELFRTFWAKFGWGQVPLTNDRVYAALLALTLAGVAGALVAAIRSWRRLPVAALFVFALAALALWLAALTRGLHLSLFESVWFPRARYAAPAISLVVLTLAAGWREWWRLAARLIPPLRRVGAWAQFGIFVAAFAVLDTYALFSVVQFFGRA